MKTRAVRGFAVRGAVVGAVACLAVAGCGDREAGRGAVPAAAALTIEARPARAPVEPPQRFVGVIVAAESVVVSPRVAGILAAVRVRPGDAVTAGQIVAELDPAPLQIELRAAEASLAAAGAATRAARIDLDAALRALTIETRAVAAGISPAQSAESARAAAQRAEAALQRMQAAQAADAARVQTARDLLADVHLRAPFGGVIAARYRDAGHRVEANAPIVRIEGRGGMWVRFAVPPQAAARVAPPARVAVMVEAIADPIEAVIERVSPTVDPASGMIFVEAALQGAALAGAAQAGALRSGLAAWVR